MPLLTPHVPGGLIDLMKNLAKEVLRDKPENIYEFAAVHFEKLIQQRDGSLDKDYEQFVAFQTHFDGQQRFAVPANCGYTCQRPIKIQPILHTKKSKSDMLAGFKAMESINEEDVLTETPYSNEKYQKAIYVIQRYYRRYMAQKKNQSSTTLTATTAAIIIQRTMRRLFANKIKLKTTNDEDTAKHDGVVQDDEDVDNVSEAASYTSSSTIQMLADSQEGRENRLAGREVALSDVGGAADDDGTTGFKEQTTVTQDAAHIIPPPSTTESSEADGKSITDENGNIGSIHQEEATPNHHTPAHDDDTSTAHIGKLSAIIGSNDQQNSLHTHTVEIDSNSSDPTQIITPVVAVGKIPQSLGASPNTLPSTSPRPHREEHFAVHLRGNAYAENSAANPYQSVAHIRKFDPNTGESLKTYDVFSQDRDDPDFSDSLNESTMERDSLENEDLDVDSLESNESVTHGSGGIAKREVDQDYAELYGNTNEVPEQEKQDVHQSVQLERAPTYLYGIHPSRTPIAERKSKRSRNPSAESTKARDTKDLATTVSIGIDDRTPEDRSEEESLESKGSTSEESSVTQIENVSDAAHKTDKEATDGDDLKSYEGASIKIDEVDGVPSGSLQKVTSSAGNALAMNPGEEATSQTDDILKHGRDFSIEKDDSLNDTKTPVDRGKRNGACKGALRESTQTDSQKPVSGNPEIHKSDNVILQLAAGKGLSEEITLENEDALSSKKTPSRLVEITNKLADGLPKIETLRAEVEDPGRLQKPSVSPLPAHSSQPSAAIEDATQTDSEASRDRSDDRLKKAPVSGISDIASDKYNTEKLPREEGLTVEAKGLFKAQKIRVSDRGSIDTKDGIDVHQTTSIETVDDQAKTTNRRHKRSLRDAYSEHADTSDQEPSLALASVTNSDDSLTGNMETKFLGSATYDHPTNKNDLKVERQVEASSLSSPLGYFATLYSDQSSGGTMSSIPGNHDQQIESQLRELQSLTDLYPGLEIKDVMSEFHTRDLQPHDRGIDEAGAHDDNNNVDAYELGKSEEIPKDQKPSEEREALIEDSRTVGEKTEGEDKDAQMGQPKGLHESPKEMKVIQMNNPKIGAAMEEPKMGKDEVSNKDGDISRKIQTESVSGSSKPLVEDSLERHHKSQKMSKGLLELGSDRIGKDDKSNPDETVHDNVKGNISPTDRKEDKIENSGANMAKPEIKYEISKAAREENLNTLTPVTSSSKLADKSHEAIKSDELKPPSTTIPEPKIQEEDYFGSTIDKNIVANDKPVIDILKADGVTLKAAGSKLHKLEEEPHDFVRDSLQIFDSVSEKPTDHLFREDKLNLTDARTDTNLEVSLIPESRLDPEKEEGKNEIDTESKNKMVDRSDALNTEEKYRGENEIDTESKTKMADRSDTLNTEENYRGENEIDSESKTKMADRSDTLNTEEKYRGANEIDTESINKMADRSDILNTEEKYRAENEVDTESKNKMADRSDTLNTEENYRGENEIDSESKTKMADRSDTLNTEEKYRGENEIDTESKNKMADRSDTLNTEEKYRGKNEIDTESKTKMADRSDTLNTEENYRGENEIDSESKTKMADRSDTLNTEEKYLGENEIDTESINKMADRSDILNTEEKYRSENEVDTASKNKMADRSDTLNTEEKYLGENEIDTESINKMADRSDILNTEEKYRSENEVDTASKNKMADRSDTLNTEEKYRGENESTSIKIPKREESFASTKAEEHASTDVEPAFGLEMSKLSESGIDLKEDKTGFPDVPKSSKDNIKEGKNENDTESKKKMADISDTLNTEEKYRGENEIDTESKNKMADRSDTLNTEGKYRGENEIDTESKNKMADRSDTLNTEGKYRGQNEIDTESKNKMVDRSDTLNTEEKYRGENEIDTESKNKIADRSDTLNAGEKYRGENESTSHKIPKREDSFASTKAEEHAPTDIEPAFGLEISKLSESGVEYLVHKTRLNDALKSDEDNVRTHKPNENQGPTSKRNEGENRELRSDDNDDVIATNGTLETSKTISIAETDKKHIIDKELTLNKTMKNDNHSARHKAEQLCLTDTQIDAISIMPELSKNDIESPQVISSTKLISLGPSKSPALTDDIQRMGEDSISKRGENEDEAYDDSIEKRSNINENLDPKKVFKIGNDQLVENLPSSSKFLKGDSSDVKQTYHGLEIIGKPFSVQKTANDGASSESVKVENFSADCESELRLHKNDSTGLKSVSESSKELKSVDLESENETTLPTNPKVKPPSLQDLRSESKLEVLERTSKSASLEDETMLGKKDGLGVTHSEINLEVDQNITAEQLEETLVSKDPLIKDLSGLQFQEKKVHPDKTNAIKSDISALALNIPESSARKLGLTVSIPGSKEKPDGVNAEQLRDFSEVAEDVMVKDKLGLDHVSSDVDASLNHSVRAVGGKIPDSSLTNIKPSSMEKMLKDTGDKNRTALGFIVGEVSIVSPHIEGERSGIAEPVLKTNFEEKTSVTNLHKLDEEPQVTGGQIEAVSEAIDKPELVNSIEGSALSQAGIKKQIEDVKELKGKRLETDILPDDHVENKQADNSSIEHLNSAPSSVSLPTDVTSCDESNAETSADFSSIGKDLDFFEDTIHYLKSATAQLTIVDDIFTEGEKKRQSGEALTDDVADADSEITPKPGDALYQVKEESINQKENRSRVIEGLVTAKADVFDQAATVIQSAVRGYRVRSRSKHSETLSVGDQQANINKPTKDSSEFEKKFIGNDSPIEHVSIEEPASKEESKSEIKKNETESKALEQISEKIDSKTKNPTKPDYTASHPAPPQIGHEKSIQQLEKSVKSDASIIPSNETQKNKSSITREKPIERKSKPIKSESLDETKTSVKRNSFDKGQLESPPGRTKIPMPEKQKTAAKPLKDESDKPKSKILRSKVPSTSNLLERDRSAKSKRTQLGRNVRSVSVKQQNQKVKVFDLEAIKNDLLSTKKVRSSKKTQIPQQKSNSPTKFSKVSDSDKTSKNSFDKSKAAKGNVEPKEQKISRKESLDKIVVNDPKLPAVKSDLNIFSDDLQSVTEAATTIENLKKNIDSSHQISATTIQKTFRGYRTRKHFKSVSATEQSKNPEMTAVTEDNLNIVNARNGDHVQKQSDIDTNKNSKESHTSGIFDNLKKDVEDFKNTALDKSATKIQKTFRGFRTRKSLKGDDESPQRSVEMLGRMLTPGETDILNKAVKSGSISVKTHLSEEMMDQKEKGQDNFVKLKNSFEDANKEALNKSATTIQKSFRGYKTRKNLKKAKSFESISDKTFTVRSKPKEVGDTLNNDVTTCTATTEESEDKAQRVSAKIDKNPKKEKERGSSTNFENLKRDVDSFKNVALDKSAVKIQKTFRGYKTRKDLISDEIVNEKSTNILNDDGETLARESESKRKAKDNLQVGIFDSSQSDAEESPTLDEFATTIQKTFRGYKARKEMLTKDTNLKEKSSDANLVQLSNSGTKSDEIKCESERVGQLQKFSKNASNDHGMKKSKSTEEIAFNDISEKAAITIQKTYKGFKARKELKTGGNFRKDIATKQPISKTDVNSHITSNSEDAESLSEAATKFDTENSTNSERKYLNAMQRDETALDDAVESFSLIKTTTRAASAGALLGAAASTIQKAFRDYHSRKESTLHKTKSYSHGAQRDNAPKETIDTSDESSTFIGPDTSFDLSDIDSVGTKSTPTLEMEISNPPSFALSIHSEGHDIENDGANATLVSENSLSVSPQRILRKRSIIDATAPLLADILNAGESNDSNAKPHWYVGEDRIVPSTDNGPSAFQNPLASYSSFDKSSSIDSRNDSFISNLQPTPSINSAVVSTSSLLFDTKDTEMHDTIKNTPKHLNKHSRAVSADEGEKRTGKEIEVKNEVNNCQEVDKADEKTEKQSVDEEDVFEANGASSHGLTDLAESLMLTSTDPFSPRNATEDVKDASQAIVTELCKNCADGVHQVHDDDIMMTSSGGKLPASELSDKTENRAVKPGDTKDITQPTNKHFDEIKQFVLMEEEPKTTMRNSENNESKKVNETNGNDTETSAVKNIQEQGDKQMSNVISDNGQIELPLVTVDQVNPNANDTNVGPLIALIPPSSEEETSDRESKDEFEKISHSEKNGKNGESNVTAAEKERSPSEVADSNDSEKSYSEKEQSVDIFPGTVPARGDKAKEIGGECDNVAVDSTDSPSKTKPPGSEDELKDSIKEETKIELDSTETEKILNDLTEKSEDILQESTTVKSHESNLDGGLNLREIEADKNPATKPTKDSQDDSEERNQNVPILPEETKKSLENDIDVEVAPVGEMKAKATTELLDTEDAENVNTNQPSRTKYSENFGEYISIDKPNEDEDSPELSSNIVHPHDIAEKSEDKLKKISNEDQKFDDNFNESCTDKIAVEDPIKVIQESRLSSEVSEDETTLHESVKINEKNASNSENGDSKVAKSESSNESTKEENEIPADVGFLEQSKLKRAESIHKDDSSNENVGEEDDSKSNSNTGEVRKGANDIEPKALSEEGEVQNKSQDEIPCEDKSTSEPGNGKIVSTLEEHKQLPKEPESLLTDGIHQQRSKDADLKAAEKEDPEVNSEDRSVDLEKSVDHSEYETKVGIKTKSDADFKAAEKEDPEVKPEDRSVDLEKSVDHGEDASKVGIKTKSDADLKAAEKEDPEVKPEDRSVDLEKSVDHGEDASKVGIKTKSDADLNAAEKEDPEVKPEDRSVDLEKSVDHGEDASKVGIKTKSDADLKVAEKEDPELKSEDQSVDLEKLVGHTEDSCKLEIDPKSSKEGAATTNEHKVTDSKEDLEIASKLLEGCLLKTDHSKGSDKQLSEDDESENFTTDVKPSSEDVKSEQNSLEQLSPSDESLTIQANLEKLIDESVRQIENDGNPINPQDLPIENSPNEVVEVPCVKKVLPQTPLSATSDQDESELESTTTKAESTTTSPGYDGASDNDALEIPPSLPDSLEAMTAKLRETEEMVARMHQRRASEHKISIEIADQLPAFDDRVSEPIRPMRELQKSSSTEVEDDIILQKLQRGNTTRESSAQSESVVFGDSTSQLTESVDTFNEGPDVKALHRMNTVAVNRNSYKPSNLLQKSVTIDDTVKYIDPEKSTEESEGSFCLDDAISADVRKKMMAYSISEADSDYYDAGERTVRLHDDFNISTALDTFPSSDTDTTIVSAATKIQAGARGFLTRRRLRRASMGTKSSLNEETKTSFGNDAIGESLDRLVEEEDDKRKSKVQYHRQVGVNSLPSALGNSTETETPLRQQIHAGDDSDDLNLAAKLTSVAEEINSTPHGEGSSIDGQRGNRNDVNGGQETDDESAQVPPNLEATLAARRLTLQRGDAMRNDSTPDDDNGNTKQVDPAKSIPATAAGTMLIHQTAMVDSTTMGTNPAEITTTTTMTTNIERRNYSDAAMTIKMDKIKWFAMRQNSMPVQIDSEVFRVLPKHMRKRIKSAEGEQRKRIRLPRD